MFVRGSSRIAFFLLPLYSFDTFIAQCDNATNFFEFSMEIEFGCWMRSRDAHFPAAKPRTNARLTLVIVEFMDRNDVVKSLTAGAFFSSGTEVKGVQL